MANIIKKVKDVIKKGINDPLGTKSVKQAKKMTNCRNQGGKWVSGKCNLGKVRTGKGEKKDWYPEKKAQSKKRKSSIKYKRKGNRKSL